MKPLEQEFHYYLAYKDKLVEQYHGKYIVIQGPKSWEPMTKN